MKDLKTIIVEKERNIALITLNRPDVMNAIDQLMIDELLLACRDIADDQEVRAVIITGRG